MRFIVTGTGHSGTGHTSAVFSRLGLACGHESVYVRFKYPDGMAEVQPWEDWRGDSSALAAPFLSDFDGLIFHQVRHPLQFMWSMTFSKGLFAPNQPWGKLLLRHCPSAAEFQEGPDPTLAWAEEFWIDWNAQIRSHHPDLTWKIEDFGSSQVEDALVLLGESRSREEITEALDVSKRKNHHTPEGIDRPEVPFSPKLKEAAEGYGYTI